MPDFGEEPYAGWRVWVVWWKLHVSLEQKKTRWSTKVSFLQSPWITIGRSRFIGTRRFVTVSTVVRRYGKSAHSTASSSHLRDFPYHNSASIRHFLATCYTYLPFHSSWPYHLNNTGRKMQLPTYSMLQPCYFALLAPNIYFITLFQNNLDLWLWSPGLCYPVVLLCGYQQRVKGQWDGIIFSKYYKACLCTWFWASFTFWTWLPTMHLNIIPYLHLHISGRPLSKTFIRRKKKQLHGPSPRANYTDRATAASRRSGCQLLRTEGATWSAWRIPTAVFWVF
jgi:hypothetical protein